MSRLFITFCKEEGEIEEYLFKTMPEDFDKCLSEVLYEAIIYCMGEKKHLFFRGGWGSNIGNR